MKTVWLVTFSDWDEHWVKSVWPSESEAKAEAARLNDVHGHFKPRNSTPGSYSVEGFMVGVAEEAEAV